MEWLGTVRKCKKKYQKEQQRCYQRKRNFFSVAFQPKVTHSGKHSKTAIETNKPKSNGANVVEEYEVEILENFVDFQL